MTTGRINQVATSFSDDRPTTTRRARCAHDTHFQKPARTHRNVLKANVATGVWCANVSCPDVHGTRTDQRDFVTRVLENTPPDRLLSPKEGHLRLVRTLTGNGNAPKETRNKTRRRPSHCGCRLHGTVRASKRFSHVPTYRSGPCHLWTAVLESAKSDLAAGQPLDCLSPCYGRIRKPCPIRAWVSHSCFAWPP